MSRFQDLKDLLERRLLSAVISDLGEQRTSGYEEEVQRQRKLLDVILMPEIKLHRADVQLLTVKKEELPPEQQERTLYPDQEDYKSPFIKEEHEELWGATGREQLQGLEEADTKFLVTTVHTMSENNDEEKPQSSLLLTDHTKKVACGEDCEKTEPTRTSDPEKKLHEVQAEASLDSGPGSEDGADLVWKETRNCLKSSKSSTNKKAETLKSCIFPEPGETNYMVSLPEKRPFSCSECGEGFNCKEHLTAQMFKMPRGSTTTKCISCKAVIGVATKTCKSCSTVQPRKQRLAKKLLKFEAKKEGWLKAQLKNKTTSHVMDEASVLLEKLNALGYRGLVFIAKPGKKPATWKTQIKHPKWQLSDQAAGCLDRMKSLYEVLVSGWTDQQYSIVSAIQPSTSAANQPSTSSANQPSTSAANQPSTVSAFQTPTSPAHIKSTATNNYLFETVMLH